MYGVTIEFPIESPMVSPTILDSLTAIGSRNRPFFYELLCSLVTSMIFVRC
jgi:hypothetical protein